MGAHDKTRREFLKTAALGAAAVSPRLFAAEEADKKRPNFIILIADDMGWSDAGCYGHPHIRTPSIDRLAKEGIRFEYAFLTCASCSPTRSSIMTGRYPHATGAAELHQPLPADQVVFAGLLKKAGYYTASAGKWHLGKAAEKNFDKVVHGGGPSGCENWVETLRDRPKDKPFFLWLAAIDPHRPYQPDKIPNPHKLTDAVVPPFLPDVPETRRDLAMYYDEITRMDGFIGQVLEELARQGIEKDTFVLFLSDNGRPFPRCKTTVYDSGVRTPFLVRWPREVDAGSVCSNLVSVVDIAPTVLDLAGLEPSPTFQGKSFAKMLRDPEQSIQEHVFAEHNWHDYKAHERSVRSKTHLYIRNAFPELPCTPPADAVRSPTFQAMRLLRHQGKLPFWQLSSFSKPRPTEELYDVLIDPHQLNNLAADPKQAEVLAKMSSVLDEWIERTGDRIPENPTPDKFNRETGRPLKKSP
jgi:arylsulfatase A-like enzyme